MIAGLDRPDALGRAIAAGASVIGRENLDQHGVIGIEVDRLYGRQVGLVAVRSELDLIGETRLKIAHERNAGVLAAVADVPRDDQLRVGINRGPRPNVARGLWRGLGELDVLFLGIAERTKSHRTGWLWR